jgi:hypothetical protein
MIRTYVFNYRVKGYESLENVETCYGTTIEMAKRQLFDSFHRVYPNKQIDPDSITLV